MCFNKSLRNIGKTLRNIDLILIVPNTMRLLRKCWGVAENQVAIASINVSIMELSRIWHPKYGDIYNVMDSLPLVVSEEKQNEKERNQESERASIRQPLLPGVDNSFAFSAVF